MRRNGGHSPLGVRRDTRGEPDPVTAVDRVAEHGAVRPSPVVAHPHRAQEIAMHRSPSALRKTVVHRIARTWVPAVIAASVSALAAPAGATTFTVKNNCSYTVFPGIFPASVFQNGGWTLA